MINAPFQETVHVVLKGERKLKMKILMNISTIGFAFGIAPNHVTPDFFAKKMSDLLFDSRNFHAD